jgi:DHA1 family bicyclomycin/chloramphenicol resistance-like MFS transporter
MGANFASIALQPFARIAGAAASVQAFLRMLVGAFDRYGDRPWPIDGSARPLARRCW